MNPSVTLTEIDQSLVVNKSSEGSAFFGGYFEKGEVGVVNTINSQQELRFFLGRGNQNNTNDWFQALNYLNYAGNLNISRATSKDSKNAVAEFPDNSSPLSARVNNIDDFELQIRNMQLRPGNSIKFMARNPGIWGNDIKIAAINYENFQDNVEIFNGIRAYDLFEILEPQEYGLVVIWEDKIVETFTFNLIPETERFIEKINFLSSIIYVKFNFILFDGNIGYYDGLDFLIDANTSIEEITKVYTDFKISFFGNKILSLAKGSNLTPELSDYEDAYNIILESEELHDIDYIIGNELIPQKCIEIGEKINSLIFVGCPRFSGTISSKINQSIDFRNSLGDSKQLVLTSGYKLFLNNYNQKYSYCNLAGDVAGLRVQADKSERWSAQAGELKGTLIGGEIEDKLNQEFSDKLYSKNINFFSSYSKFFGNKICTSEQTALDRINVRNLANFLAKSLEKTSRNFIFEQIDSYTKEQILSTFKIFLEEVKASRGIEDYFVKVTEQAEYNTYIIDVIYKPVFVAEFVQVRMINSGTTKILVGAGV